MKVEISKGKIIPRLKNLKEKTQYRKAPKERNKLTLAPLWIELTLNSTVKPEMTIDSHVTVTLLHNPKTELRGLGSGGNSVLICSKYRLLKLIIVN